MQHSSSKRNNEQSEQRPKRDDLHDCLAWPHCGYAFRISKWLVGVRRRRRSSSVQTDVDGFPFVRHPHTHTTGPSPPATSRPHGDLKGAQQPEIPPSPHQGPSFYRVNFHFLSVSRRRRRLFQASLFRSSSIPIHFSTLDDLEFPSSIVLTGHHFG